jgi:hypothetical protein
MSELDYFVFGFFSASVVITVLAVILARYSASRKPNNYPVPGSVKAILNDGETYAKVKDLQLYFRTAAEQTQALNNTKQSCIWAANQLEQFAHRDRAEKEGGEK